MATSHAWVVLVTVDEAMLDDLVEAATTQARADEVTPPLTPGPEWSPERVAWLRAYHRDRRPGIDGPEQEAIWAVVVGQQVVGSVRVKRADREGVVETGAWLVRDARGQGIGSAALAAVLQKARNLGATEVRAETTASNTGALETLRRRGFDLSYGEDQAVHAVIRLRS